MRLSRAPAALLRAVLRGYQLAISPMFPTSCRFEPSCSQYGIEAIAEHGAWRGLWLTARRVGRCHPLGGFGPDPVPRRIPRGGPRGS